jgi:hypothetical protein
VNQQIVDVLTARKYVVFHHSQTTQRDFGGFYGNGKSATTPSRILTATATNLAPHAGHGHVVATRSNRSLWPRLPHAGVMWVGGDPGATAPPRGHRDLWPRLPKRALPTRGEGFGERVSNLYTEQILFQRC